MTNQKTIKIACEFCGGTGYIERFAHVEDGVCYGCKGKGYNMITPAQAEKLEEERQQANKFEMVIVPASYNTYNDKEVIKSLGFKFNPSYGWIMVIDVETMEEAKEKHAEVGAEARAKGLHGTFMMNSAQIESIESPRHMQQVLKINLDRTLGN